MLLTKKEMGQSIKKARENKSKKIGIKYTQSMLAEDLNISRGYLGDIENGRIYPNYVLLNRIADACNVTPTFFADIHKIIKESILLKYPSMGEKEQEDFTNYVINQRKAAPDRTDELDIEFCKILFDDNKIENYIGPNNGNPLIYPPNETDYGYDSSTKNITPKINDIKEAMELILSQPGLMLNGELLSDESKIALANAIKLGLQYAEQMQKKDKGNK